MRKIKIKEIVCIIGLLGTLTAHSQNTVWQIGNKDKSAKEFKFYKNDYRNYINDVYLYEVGRNHSADFPYFLPGPSDAWAGGISGQAVIGFSLAEAPSPTTQIQLRLLFAETHPSSPPRLEVRLNRFEKSIQTPEGTNPEYLNTKETASKELSVTLDIPADEFRAGNNTLTIQNISGSWVAFDQIKLTSDSPLQTNNLTTKASLVSSAFSPVLVVGKKKELRQPVKIKAVNWHHKKRPVELQVGNFPPERYVLSPGINNIETSIPEVTAPCELPIILKEQGKTVSKINEKATPVKKWTVYLVQHTHTDIGYTKPQTEILSEHLRYIDYAIEYCEQTKDYTDDAKFRWTCESAWAVDEYLKNRPEEQVNKLKKYIAEGQIEVASMYFNMSEIVDESSFKTFLQPVKEFRKHGIPSTLAMQNDVNGIAWCLADYLPDLGIKYLWMGEHHYKSQVPFNMPTVFQWESPSGKPILTYRADHYNTGNFWGIEQGDIQKTEPKLLHYLSELERKHYPFDAVGVQYSGYFTDNSPPSIIECKLIREWNEKYAYPKLRSATASEFLDYVTKRYGDKIPAYRAAYPDWWTDGFGSAARETAASRKTHSDMTAVEGLLSMAVLKDKCLPQTTHQRIEHIHESLLFYDEHTFGASESVSDPLCENSQVQWGEKSAYAWEAVKRTQMLYETSVGLLQGDLRRGKNPTLTIFNTLNWKRSEMLTVYIDFEVIPRNQFFEITDFQGHSLKVQPIRYRKEGCYYAIFAEDIPPMGYKTFEIVFKQPSTDTGTITINNASIENHFYKLQLNPDKGTIQSLYDKELNCELVDSSSPWELGAFIYEKLGNRDQLAQYRLDDYNRTGLSECRIIDSSNGPIYQRILLQGKSPGTDEAFGVNLEIKLYHDTKRIELEYAIKRLPETDPSGIYVAFPFQLPEGKLAFDVQGGTVTSGKNQLEGTSTDWNTVQNFVSVQNNRAQIIIGSSLIPLYQLGDINLGKFQYQKQYDRPHVYSWVMNNYWNTNFKASQEGEFRWSYHLTSSVDPSNNLATKFGWSSRIPLYARVMPTGTENHKPTEYSAFHFEKDNFLMTSCTPSKEEGYILLNIREIDGKRTNLRILNEDGQTVPFTIVNAIEEKLENETSEHIFEGYQNKFIKIKRF